MKVIGEVRPEWEEDSDHVVNSDYVGGIIIQLTQQEANVLKQLQDAWSGLGWNVERIMGRQIPDDILMDEMFVGVQLFIVAKMAINDLKSQVETLEKIVIMEEDNDNE